MASTITDRVSGVVAGLTPAAPAAGAPGSTLTDRVGGAVNGLAPAAPTAGAPGSGLTDRVGGAVDGLAPAAPSPGDPGSTITDRIGGAVDGGSSPTRKGFGIIQITGVAGTDTITGLGSPTITSYVLHQFYLFRPAIANTGPVTVNWDGVGARALVSPGGGALAGGELSTTQDYVIHDDGTNMVIVAPF